MKVEPRKQFPLEAGYRTVSGVRSAHNHQMTTKQGWLLFEQVAYDHPNCRAVKLTLELHRWRIEQRSRLRRKLPPFRI
jgi:hypothetical protein